MPSRRTFLKSTAGVVVAVSGGLLAPKIAYTRATDLGPSTLPQGALGSAVLDALPGKQRLIKRTYRPPNYETPIECLNAPFTSNDCFFVRYHHGAIPEVRAPSWTLTLGGEGASGSKSYSLADLRAKFETVEIPALCLCAGNRRGFFEPHVPGIQWGHGAMGNAVWKGIRLRDVLNDLGINKNAVEVTFDGADAGVLDKTPDFIKSLPLWKALDEHTLIAFEMNGAALPRWNGFPARLVVPGWTATYWVKHLTAIKVVTQAFDGFWMKTAYRIPQGKFALTDRFLSQDTELNTPITEILINSLITNLVDGQKFSRQRAIDITGIAWDGGHGIERVELSTDGGQRWQTVILSKDYGNYSWRPWHYRFVPDTPGRYTVVVRATNRVGNTQPSTLIANPAGYHHNVMPRLTIHVT
jgi:DMSO/TMAO reductase YedYZ molybdopterin-dependent catalytic subunit